MAHIGFDKDKVAQLSRENDIAFIGVFGSFARGDFTKDSDLDLLVRFSKRKSLVDQVRIEREFSEVLKRKVDLLTEMSISPYLRDRIKREVQVIYEAG
jgi:hypothetical protein